ncbi:MAG: DUF1273 domain-containing protein [Oscillospiraceae bacterium]|nr:DUF1273 domain-containing protein [Oscillospiraceae bacterium]
MIILDREETITAVSPKLPPVMFQALPSLGITGHRPNKLPHEKDSLHALEKAVHYQLDCRLREGFRCFYTGLADGADYMATIYLAKQRRDYPDLMLFGIQPFPDYETFYEKSYSSIRTFYYMKAMLDELIVLSGNYAEKESFHQRNKFIVRHSDAVLGICGISTRSGSSNTIRYAKDIHVPYWRIEPKPNTTYLPPPEDWYVEYCQDTGNIYRKHRTT